MTLRLAPKAIATALFGIDPDRDERASQLCAETLLTLTALEFAPSDQLQRSPKQRRFALRSLVFGVNFLSDQTEPLPGDDEMTAARYGHLLAIAEDFHGSQNLVLARTALANLIDPSTEQGTPAQHLLMPFHRSLLWYDARASGGRYTARKVRMRGSGITLARMLAAPPQSAGQQTAARAGAAVEGIRNALEVESPLARAAEQLEAALPHGLSGEPQLEAEEMEAWARGGEDRLAGFATGLCSHADGVVGQGGASPPARIWQLRSVLALDLAVDCLRRAWQATSTPAEQQALLLAVAGPSRPDDRVRLRSERSYAEARMALLHARGGIDWSAEVDGRTRRRLDVPVIQPYRPAAAQDFQRTAQLVFENANYNRPGDGVRVLLESIGMSAGGTRYRYLSASPDLLAALVGALSHEMPMTSHEFFVRLAQEWGLVVSPEAARGTVYAQDLEGSSLAANARRFERVLMEAGLASGLSDRTVLVGERAGRGRA